MLIDSVSCSMLKSATAGRTSCAKATLDHKMAHRITNACVDFTRIEDRIERENKRCAMFVRLTFAAAMMLVATSGHAHELYLKPDSYQIELGDRLQAEIKVGEEFEGGRYIFIFLCTNPPT
jgi:hypothetical protein